MNLLFPERILRTLGLLPETTLTRQQQLEGEILTIVRPNQEWRVKFNASQWTARSEQPIDFKPGERVRILGYRIIDGRTSNTLLIAPL